MAARTVPGAEDRPTRRLVGECLAVAFPCKEFEDSLQCPVPESDDERDEEAEAFIVL